MKKASTLILFLVLTALWGCQTTSDDNTEISVYCNEEKLAFDVPPVSENGMTLVPLRTIFESLDAKVRFFPQSKKVVASKNNKVIALTIGDSLSFINGRAHEMSVPAKIIEERTFVPLRFVAESLGAEVNWDPNSQTIKINIADHIATLMHVHFLNVGQGDSILIQDPTGKVMLIDAGKAEDYPYINNYLENLNIEKIDILVATHPHDDHIGSMAPIIKNYDIGAMYLPNINYQSDLYNEMIKTIQKKNIPLPDFIGGDEFTLGKSTCTILAPNINMFNNINNASIVIKLQYGIDSFLFTGNAEKISENEMLKKNYDLQANVLKIANSGNSTSTSENFLAAISPQYAIISLGPESEYQKTENIVQKRLHDHNVQIFRTDLNGTIIATSDGTSITFTTEYDHSDQK